MKKQILTFFLASLGLASTAQNVGIGTNTPNTSAKLDITSTNSGILIPRVSLVDIANGLLPVAGPATGLLVYNNNAAVVGGTGAGFYYWDGALWQKLSSSAGAGNVVTTTTGVTITNGLGQVVGLSNVIVDVATNSATSPGLVLSGAGQNTKVWGTDILGNPTWRDVSAMLTKNDITTSTTGVTVTNGTGQVVGVTGVAVDVATNSVTSPGLVSSGAGQNTKVWGTDAAGNPAWVEPTLLANVQNGLNLNTTAPNGTPTNPYIELGGTLIRNTTVTQGAYNMLFDMTGAGIFRVNHVNTTATTIGTYPFGVNRAGSTDYTIGSDASYSYNQTWNNKPLVVNSQGNNILLNPNSGNVGVGNMTPLSKVDISAAARSGVHGSGFPLYVTGSLTPGSAGGLGIEFRHDNGTQGIGFGYNTIYATGSNANQDLGTASRGIGHLLYTTNGSERMRIVGNTGYVGIGTTLPIQNLDVNGRVNVTNGVIQRGTTQITATADLGLYSQIAGNWIRIASNGAPIKFFADQGGGNSAGTNAIMAIDNTNGGGVMIASETTGTGNAGVPNGRAALELSSTTKGMLTTRLTTAQRNAMGNALAEGLLIYNTDNNCYEFWDTKATPAGGNGFWNSLCQWCQNVVVISASASGYNLNSALGGGRAEHYCVYINAGVTLQGAGNGGGSGAAGNPGFNASTMPTGASITLYNYGNILAGGGNGGIGASESDDVCSGNGNSGAGGRGGDAILTNGSVAIDVYNYGVIRAGGGGGGGAGAGCCSAGGGGGGGAGTPAGTGGAGRCYNCTGGFVCGCGGRTGCSGGGAAGTATTAGGGGGGSGSSGSGCSGNSNGGTGATGGVNAVAGSNQGTGCCDGAGCAGATGGGAGLALQGNGSGSSISNFGTQTGAVNP